MKSNRILIETLVITVISLGGILLLRQIKLIFTLLPIAYLLIERRLRHRKWADLGFKFKSVGSDLLDNWFWFVLAGVISQPVWFLIEHEVAPEIVNHIIERLPFPLTMDGIFIYLIPLAIILLGEEMTHRTLIQGRLTPFMGTAAAITVASLVFGLSHYAARPFMIVALDISSIIFDSILFGIIYARSNNLVVCWAAHLLGDILGLALLILTI